nr:hypothetical protein Q903MT_gene3031 [Picea sitchensis]
MNHSAFRQQRQPCCTGRKSLLLQKTETSCRARIYVSNRPPTTIESASNPPIAYLNTMNPIVHPASTAYRTMGPIGPCQPRNLITAYLAQGTLETFIHPSLLLTLLLTPSSISPCLIPH